MTDDFKIRFLIVDDEQSIRKLCMTIGASLGFECAEAGSGEAALAYLETESPDIVLVDRMLGSMSGDEVLRQGKTLLPRAEFAIITGHGSIESAVEAMKLGAYDYITKPFGAGQLKLLLQRMKDKVKLVAENEYLKQMVSNDMELNVIDGSSSKIQDILRMISRLKDTRTPVLITGESGTGKELVARAIHFRGAMSKRPFVAVDCGSLVPTLIESELFGHEKGAFTGAMRTKQGLFLAANGGTIFLDEIGELPLEMQAKLLRVLQEKEIRPVGSNQRIKIDVRVIAATNRDLEASYRVGTFRKDLYFRLNVVTINIPPLRERRSDIPALIQAFLHRYSPDQKVMLTAAAMNAMLQYDWPGNVRELENCIERAIALGNRQTIDVTDLPSGVGAIASGAPMKVTTASDASNLEELEKDTIRRVFEQSKGDKVLAGRMLGISRATLYRKLKRYGIDFEKKAMAAANLS